MPSATWPPRCFRGCAEGCTSQEGKCHAPHLFRGLGPLRSARQRREAIGLSGLRGDLGGKSDCGGLRSADLRQEPLSSQELAGEWLLVVSAAGLGIPSIQEVCRTVFWMRCFLLLATSGASSTATAYGPGMSNVLLDDASSRALAFRLKLVREALNLDYESFYGIMGIHSGTGEAIESERLGYAAPDEEMLKRFACITMRPKNG